MKSVLVSYAYNGLNGLAVCDAHAEWSEGDVTEKSIKELREELAKDKGVSAKSLVVLNIVRLDTL